MRQFFTAGAAALTIVTFSAIAVAQNVPETPRPGLDLVNRTQQTYIFRLAPDTSPAEVQRIAREVAGVGGGRPDHVYTKVMRGFSARLSDAALAEIEEDFPEIIGIQRNNIFTIAKGKPPGSPGKGPGSGEDESGTGDIIDWGVALVLPQVDGEPEIQSCGANGGDCRTIWILDTGVDFDTDDLNMSADHHVSCVDPARSDGSFYDRHGHGTHVAGTAGAKAGNGKGVVGVAAGATIVSVRVLDRNGMGTTAEVVCGIEWVAENASSGDIANMSLGGPADPAIDGALEIAANKVLFSLAAGNNRTHADSRSPARVNHTSVFTVSAIDSRKKFANFSNYGNPPVDFAAPGVNILSLTPGGGTTTKSGTSMAAPHVAGLLSLQGWVGCQGKAKNDPDGNRDDIAHLTGSC